MIGQSVHGDVYSSRPFLPLDRSLISVVGAVKARGYAIDTSYFCYHPVRSLCSSSHHIHPDCLATRNTTYNRHRCPPPTHDPIAEPSADHAASQRSRRKRLWHDRSRPLVHPDHSADMEVVPDQGYRRFEHAVDVVSAGILWERARADNASVFGRAPVYFSEPMPSFRILIYPSS